ncbi:glycosyltransferase family 39 protein [Massilia arenosa]|uniref:Glycosyltransferase family 39 protein n=1 Tax=Zemynaea arenosa TaxID=2561931 RepID=A0A4Y9S959_9BURK|nr:glycosyltransferase family 39 protein [Massilia arenosa]TFW18269.1 glycosyltransferase family 39 protein [Massilia arenosa]
MNDLHANRRFLWALFILFALVSLFVLDLRALVPPDEGRYAEMAREMWRTGDWVTTRLNGIKYFEKPPLQTWMNAATFAAFGLGEWQARLWTGACGILGVVLTWYAGLKVFNSRVGLYGALVLGSCFYWAACGQIDSLDMSLSGMMTIALMALLVAQRDDATPAERRNWMLVCWAGMALSMLAKGLIGLVLPGGVLVIYTLVARDWKIWTRLHLGKGLLLFFAIATPWFVLVGLRNPEQPHFFFVHEHFDRFLLKEHHREAPWYTFFVLTAIGMLPWLGVLPQAIRRGWQREDSVFRPRLMLLVWFAFIVLFFTKSNSKLPGYILPVFPALALLTASYLEDGTRRSRMLAAGILALVGIGLLALVPFIPKMKHNPGELPLLEAFAPWISAAGLLALVGGLASMLWARQLKRDLSVLALAIAGFGATELALAGFAPYGAQRAALEYVPAIKAELGPQSRVFSVKVYEQSLTYYLDRTVTLVDYWDEFTFGLQQQPQLSIPTVDAWVAEWTRDAQAGIKDVAVINNELVPTLQKQGVPLRIIGADGRRTIAVNK